MQPVPVAGGPVFNLNDPVNSEIHSWLMTTCFGFSRFRNNFRKTKPTIYYGILGAGYASRAINTDNNCHTLEAGTHTMSGQRL